MKMKKSALLLSIVLLFALLCTPMLAADATVQIESTYVEVECEAGSIVEVPVRITKNPGLVVGRVDVEWNAAFLELVEVVYTEGLGQNNGSPEITQGFYPVSFGDYTPGEDPGANWTDTGLLFTLKFEIKEDVPADTMVAIDLSGKNDSFLNNAVEEQVVEFVSGDVFIAGMNQDITVDYTEIEATFGDAPIALNAEAETALTYYVTEGEDVIEVNENGVVTFKKAGTAEIVIAAESGNGYSSATRVIPVTVAKAEQVITTSVDMIEAKPGDEPVDFPTATAKGDVEVTYDVTNDGVIAIEDGKISFLKAGTAKITFAAAETERYKAATADVIINVSLNTQVITAENMTATYGDAAKNLNAEAETTLTYEVTDGEDVVTVDAEGNVTFLKGGEAEITITAAAENGYAEATKVVTVTVAKAEQTITTSVDEIEVNLGDEPTPLPTATAKGDVEVTYAITENDGVIAIEDGKISFLKAGTAKITFTAAETEQYEAAEKDVIINVGLNTQVITAENMTATYGDAAKNLNAEAETTLTYEVTDGADVVTVDENGVVTFLKGGEAEITITAAAENGYAAATKVVTVTVAKAEQILTANPDSITVNLIENEVTAPVVTTNGNGAISSSITKGENVINHISAEGKIYLLEVGEAEITYAAAETDQYKAASLTVSVQVTEAANQIMGCPETLELELKLPHNNNYVELNDITATSGNVSFALKEGEPENIIEIDGTTITYKNAGTVKLLVCAGGTGYETVTKEITVTVKPLDLSAMFDVAASQKHYATKNSSTLPEVDIMEDLLGSGEIINATLTMYADAELTQPLGDKGFADANPGDVVDVYFAFTFGNTNYKNFSMAGKITIVAVGDVNCDGKVSAADAMILFRKVAEWNGYDERILCPDAAEIDATPGTSLSDASYLARYLAGWDGYDL